MKLFYKKNSIFRPSHKSPATATDHLTDHMIFKLYRNKCIKISRIFYFNKIYFSLRSSHHQFFVQKEKGLLWCKVSIFCKNIRLPIFIEAIFYNYFCNTEYRSCIALQHRALVIFKKQRGRKNNRFLIRFQKLPGRKVTMLD